MQFLMVGESLLASELSDRVGDRNVEDFLSTNNLDRDPNLGQALQDRMNYITSDPSEVPWQRKATMLNNFVDDSDIFEEAALADESTWKMLDQYGTFPNSLKVPETMTLPSSSDVLGNGEPVGKSTYDATMNALATGDHTVDPAIFNKFSVMKGVSTSGQPSQGNPFNNIFPLPWGDITVYSTLSNESVDIPAYPEELQDGVVGNYTAMPDLLYQYEPWLIYTGSGPRSLTFTFDLHRDMWSGDHADGSLNNLVRFLQASCYPRYTGSAVYSDTVYFYLKGELLIAGKMLEVAPKWDGPLLDDGFYAMCHLSFTIKEQSTRTLDYDTVRNMGIIQ